ncbi:MAG TPA: cytochrome c oxidase subunit 3 [Caulobacterales bacterium]|jgi:cytochrome c oxidase subunit 3|nr:cytochrome c oxidase subunit 3 [Caulobacterales bacterium]
MAHSHDVHHDYHLVNPSPWPAVGSVAVLILTIGAVVAMKGLAQPSDAAGFAAQFGNAVLLKGKMWLLGLGALGVALTMFGWWGDMIKESSQGDHTPVVDIGMRYGMILFIASEVMFFVAWFWVFFELAIFHNLRSGWVIGGDAEAMKAWANWPPPHVDTFDPFHLPLLNTLILLTSGTTVTWAHHALQTGDRTGARNGLILTVLLGMLFTFIQFGLEYPHAGFAFGNQGDVSNATLYGASFFMATGFHGVHVIIGTIFLLVCLLRLLAGQFTPEKHFGLEAAAWYWHFVDVVWLFLFTFVYVTPKLALEG